MGRERDREPKMRKKQLRDHQLHAHGGEEQHHDHDVELLKAVAQAWHAQTGNPKPTNERDARRRTNSSTYKPSRFRLEALRSSPTTSWDFSRSLWDSYELVTLSQRLEAGLALHDHQPPTGSKRPRESKNSLRRLFSRYSSKRLDADAVSIDEQPPAYLS